MTTRRNRADEYRDRIFPFLEDWEERGLAPWQQFRNWSVQQVLWDAGLSMDEVEDVTRVDGQRDEGIDGWYFDDSTSPPRLVLIQSKDTSIAREDFSKMKDGLLNLLVPGRPTNANRPLLERARLFQNPLPEEFEVHFYLTSSVIAQSNLSPDPSGDPWHSEILQLPSLGKGVQAHYFVRDIKYLVENIQVMHEEPIVAKFRVGRGEYFQYSSGDHTLTVTAAVRADDLATLYQREKQNLFRKNPRYYLGSVIRNKEMKETLTEPQNEDFFIFNNGLTCVGEAIKVIDLLDDPNSVEIQVNDFQIVNGCQTTATVAAATLEANLGKVRVLAKIVENPRAGSEEGDATSDKIATSSNRQNPLEAQDWKANDRRQQKWHVEFLRGIPAPWFYEIKRGTWGTEYGPATRRAPFKDPVTTKFRKMTMKDLGQQCWAFLGYAAEAIEKPRDIFNKNTLYDHVFDESLTAPQLLLPHLVYVAADAKTKSFPTYALEQDDPEFERHREARIVTLHLRHPVVAAVGAMLARLRNAEVGYLPREQSLQLIARRSEWLDSLIDKAFDKFARALLLASARRNLGARTVVRSSDWMTDSLYDLATAILTEVRTEQRMGGGPGTLVDALPFPVS